jgi:hypothetical protein
LRITLGSPKSESKHGAVASEVIILYIQKSFKQKEHKIELKIGKHKKETSYYHISMDASKYRALNTTKILSS